MDKDDKVFTLCFSGLFILGLVSLLKIDETILSMIILLIIAIVFGGILYILFSKESNNK